MTCNKMYFNNKSETLTHIKKQHRDSRHYKSGSTALLTLYPYKCNICDGWHTTSMPRKMARIEAKKNKRRGARIEAIKNLRANPTMNHFLQIKSSWMILNEDDFRSWVTFTEKSGFTGRIVLTK